MLDEEEVKMHSKWKGWKWEVLFPASKVFSKIPLDCPNIFFLLFFSFYPWLLVCLFCPTKSKENSNIFHVLLYRWCNKSLAIVQPFFVWIFLIVPIFIKANLTFTLRSHHKCGQYKMNCCLTSASSKILFIRNSKSWAFCNNMKYEKWCKQMLRMLLYILKSSFMKK